MILTDDCQLLVANGNTNRFQERRTRRRFINTSIPYFPAEVEHRLRGIDDVSGSLHTRTNQDDLSLRHSKEDHQTKEKERHDARSQQSSAYYNKERFGHSSKICRKEEEQQEEIHEQNRHKKNVVLGLQKNEKSGEFNGVHKTTLDYLNSILAANLLKAPLKSLDF